MIAYQRKTGKIGSSGYVNKNVRLVFIDYKTRQPVSANKDGEIWCQAPNIMVVNDLSKSLESKYDLQRTNEGLLHLSLIDFIIIISKIAYKIQQLCKSIIKR